MLYELEANYIKLEQRLLAYISVYCPQQFQDTKIWLNQMSKLPVSERTLYVAEMCDFVFSMVITDDEITEWLSMKEKISKDYMIRPDTLSIFELTLSGWAPLTR